MESSEDIPRNERSARRALVSLAIVAVGVAVGGVALDLYVLATHHLSTAHVVSNVIGLITLVIGSGTGVKYYREARDELTALRSSESRDQAGT